MSKTLIRDLTVVTLDESGTLMRGADLGIENGLIGFVGQAPPDFAADEILDGHNKAALPGLVNAHCHSPMTFERGWAEDLPFDRWLNEKIWVQESVLTSDDVYWGAALAACEMIRSGTVMVSDKYFHMDRTAQVIRESGMKAALTWTVFGLDNDRAFTGRDLDGTVDWIRDLQAEGNPRLRTFLGPHSPYICSPDFIQRVVQLAHELGQGIHLHLAESQAQVEASLERYGQRPVQLMDSLGVFDVPGGCVAAHCLALDEADTHILAVKGVHVPFCPITYMKLAMPFPTLEDRLSAGVRVCLGTDGPASNSDLDMFAVIRQTALINKYEGLNPALIPGDQALRLATRREALGFAGAGTLAPGQPADLILVDLDRPHFHPIHSLIANLIHCAKGGDVSDVMVDGAWLMRDRQLQTLDEERILAEAERRAQDMTARGMTSVREYRS
jgi:5-methylthioadenosine/S-adenosylhomocysteine deaminase